MRTMSGFMGVSMGAKSTGRLMWTTILVGACTLIAVPRITSIFLSDRSMAPPMSAMMAPASVNISSGRNRAAIASNMDLSASLASSLLVKKDTTPQNDPITVQTAAMNRTSRNMESATIIIMGVLVSAFAYWGTYFLLWLLCGILTSK